VFVAKVQTDLRADARKRRLCAIVDRLLTEAVHLGVSADDLQTLVAERMKAFQFGESR
jgi:predicted ATPase